jgi:hypothetical protein
MSVRHVSAAMTGFSPVVGTAAQSRIIKELRKMGSWWKSDRFAMIGLSCKSALAAGSVAGLLLVAACGDKEESNGQAASEAAPVAAIDPAQAPLIQKAIEDYLLLAEGPESQRVVHHGSVKVTPGTDAFDVAIDGVYIGPKEGGRLDVGTVNYRLTPKGTDGYLASDLKHATTMSVKEKDGKESGKLTLNTKAFSAEWSSNLQAVLAMDWQIADISAKDNAPNAGDFSAAALNILVASTDKGSGVIDQTATFDVVNLAAKDQAQGTFSLGKMTIKGVMAGLKVKEYVAKSREMQIAMAEIAEAQMAAASTAQATADGSSNATPTAPAAEMTPEQRQKLSDALKGMAGLLSGIVYDIDLADIGFKNPDGSEPFHLAKGNFDLGFTGLDTEKGSMTFGLGHEGLVIKDPAFAVSPIYQKVLPTSGNLALKLDDVPSKEFWALVGDNFPSMMTADAAQAEVTVQVMGIAMQQLMMKSPMKLTVAPSGLNSEALQVDLTGAFDVKPDAAYGVVGGLDINLHGLDTAMALANEAAKTSPDAAQIVGTLAMIQAMAKRENGSDGKPVDKLKLEVDAVGATKVNGTPFP